MTTPVFNHPLLSPDVIILVENLDTVGEILCQGIFLEIVLVFLVMGVSAK